MPRMKLSKTAAENATPAAKEYAIHVMVRESIAAVASLLSSPRLRAHASGGHGEVAERSVLIRCHCRSQ